MTRTIAFFSILLLASSFSEGGRWLIDRTSVLAIHGSTNINNFTCKTEYYAGRDTLHFVRNYVACEIQFASNRMVIPVVDFDCGGAQISKDFRKTLKSEQFPHLEIRFRSLKNTSLVNHSFIYGVADITLAGVTRCFTIGYRVELKDGDTILLHGTHRVHFSDFNLVAPQRLNGLIKVKDNLDVQFDLVLKKV